MTSNTEDDMNILMLSQSDESSDAIYIEEVAKIQILNERPRGGWGI